MNPGIRSYKHASCRVHAPDSLPAILQPRVRELLDLRSEKRKVGEARDLMFRVCKEADFHHMVLMLTAKPYEEDGMPSDRLKKFYARFGFFIASQKQPDIMIRAPRPK